MSAAFVLIPGRTSRQGAGISQGKFGEDYQEEIHAIQMTPQDMQGLGLSAGDRIRITSEAGQVDTVVVASRGDELPPGMLFVAYGEVSSRLMGGDTHGSGMPTSKGIDVQVEAI
jgi:formylmethanofuran dehydrogenase subunit D